MFKKVSLFAALAAVCWATETLAVNFPYKAHGEQNIDTHQVGYGDVVLTAGGTMKIHYKFSNGKKVAGNNFYGVTYLHDASNNVFGYFVQWRGVDASLGGKAKEGDVDGIHKLTPEQLATFDHVSFRFGAKNCGLRVSDFHFIDKGISVGLEEAECGNVP
ncbi:hypothetical protein [Rhizobium leguminosarum]|uniref:hypothetical protein n=1 Tax=Rhizobium leguminosarum TaxID=384 RepID=UPI001C985BBC|nr:hypothetical protein [Rhizobium leguminosarum]MBY5439341.1 hypothetical protein [Rhizobium leguminosarum]